MSKKYTDAEISKIQISSGATTDVEFTYDGDHTSDAHSWIVNYTGVKIYVKVGEVPRGKLNLVGGYATGTTPSNMWLNYTCRYNRRKN